MLIFFLLLAFCNSSIILGKSEQKQIIRKSEIKKSENKRSKFIEETINNKSENSKIPIKTPLIFRIMTYNVNKWKGSSLDSKKKNMIDPIMEILDFLNPDLVILQEVTPNAGSEDGDMETGEIFIKLKKRFKNISGCNILPKDDLFSRKWLGNVIASKYMLDDIKVNVYDKEVQPICGWRSCFLFFKITLPNKENIYVYGTRLDSRGLDFGLIQRPLLEILAAINSSNFLEKNVLIAGDFNFYSLRQMALVKRLLSLGYKDCFTYLNWQYPSYTSLMGEEEDFIFLSKKWNLSVAGSYVYYSTHSEHLPIILDIDLNGEVKYEQDLFNLNMYLNYLKSLL